MTPTSTAADPKLDLIPTTTTTSTPANFHCNVLVAGPKASGKTHFGCSFPDVFCIYCEQNKATIEKFPGLSIAYISSWQQFDTYAIPALRRHSWFGLNEKGEAELIPLTCRTCFLDGASLLHTLCVEHLSLTYDGFKLWKIVLAKWTNVMRTLADLSKGPNACHVVVSCDIRQHENEAGNVTDVTLNFNGQSADAAPKPFDSVFLLDRQVIRKDNAPLGEITGTRNLMYTVNPDRRYKFVGDGVGGGQFNKLPPTLENTYQALFAAWGVSTA